MQKNNHRAFWENFGARAGIDSEPQSKGEAHSAVIPLHQHVEKDLDDGYSCIQYWKEAFAYY
eukprot:305010-Pelagomonas_calceolata.AAC.4